MLVEKFVAYRRGVSYSPVNDAIDDISRDS